MLHFLIGSEDSESDFLIGSEDFESDAEVAKDRRAAGGFSELLDTPNTGFC